MSLKTKILIGLIIAFAVSSSLFYFNWKAEKKERIRQETNVKELTKNVDQANMDLTLTRREFEDMKTKWKNDLDSIMKANNLKLKRVTEVYTMELAYRDSIAKMAIMGKPEPIKPEANAIIPQSAKDSKARYKLAFSQADSCFSVSGNVFTSDPLTKVQITDRGYETRGDLFATRERFLKVLWWKKPSKYVAITKCGKIEYGHIKFIK